ncbi:MAG: amidohydrolase, partial [Coprobacillus sp.]|nr:amidohydrolase [Coprobacillus sp.]
GHDGHMTALLGLAYKLKDVQDLPHNVLLIFQPGEEVVNGAPSIINTGIFEKYHVKGIYGLHMFPDVDEGKIACRKGPLMAESGELDVTVHGKSAHAGKYHEGIDSIVIASFLISNYQSIISRMISPMQPCVLNIGEIHGGTVRNIVASQTSFHGTLRTYSEEVFSRIVEAMKGFNQGMEQAYHCQIDFACQPFNPPVLNDAHLYEELKKNVGANFEELEEPVMLAEDFAHYQKVIPGVFFYVGTRCKEYTSGLHTPTFNFHEEVLVQAVELYEKLARNVQLGD